MSSVQGLVKGLHHITLVTSNQEVNRRFYTEVLGLRRVKLTVNQDDIYHRHLFYADNKGTTGSAITFFEWPDLPKGRVGLGSPHHLAYNANLDSLPKWKAWLASQNVPASGPFVRNGRVSLYLSDPDGVTVEIAAVHTESASEGYIRESDQHLPDVHEISLDMRLSTFNHASPVTSDPNLTSRFFDKLLGLAKSSTSPNPDQSSASILGLGNEESPEFLRYLHPPQPREGFVGIGN
ncbi:MAG: VOC family protein, partial [Thaumarchaeota archaeon]|nr:VOC family protein [Nitrososphaerota archaeon]